MRITKEELINEYEKITTEILNECDWKTHFNSNEICGIVYNILRMNFITPIIPLEEFHERYLEKSNEFWHSKITSVECLEIIYEMLIDINLQ